MGSGLGGVSSIYQGHLFFQKATYDLGTLGPWDPGTLGPEFFGRTSGPLEKFFAVLVRLDK